MKNSKSNSIKSIALVALTSATLFAATNANAAMDPYLESALIDVCKSAQSNNVLRMRNTIKGYHLKEQTVALNLVCNGENVVSFAENSGANKTANHLESRLGKSEIVDLAQLYSVNF